MKLFKQFELELELKILNDVDNWSHVFRAGKWGSLSDYGALNPEIALWHDGGETKIRFSNAVDGEIHGYDFDVIRRNGWTKLKVSQHLEPTYDGWNYVYEIYVKYR